MNTSIVIRNTLAVVLTCLAGVASADEITKEGYVTDTDGDIVRSGSGLCIRTGFWKPEMAIASCEGGVQEAAVEPPAVIPPAVIPTPTPIVISLQSDTLFEFNKAIIRPAGKEALDAEVVGKMKAYPQIESILVTGHADRIGSDAYNLDLSQQRAEAVRVYLVGQGVKANRIETVAKGESEPVVSCEGIKGKVNGKNSNLVSCLKPNRRVEISIQTQN